MNKKETIVVISVVFILIMVLLCFKLLNNNSLKVKDLENLNNYNYSIVFIGDKNKENDALLKKLADEVIYTNYIDDDINNINEYLYKYGLNAFDNSFILFMNGIPIYVMDYNLSFNEYNNLINKYFYGYYDNNYLINPANSDEYFKYINSKNYTLVVIGKSDCPYCNKFKPVLNNITNKYNLNTIYIEKNNYDTVEYNKIVELNFSIPGKCTTQNQDTTLAEITATPLTIITKNGKYVDCVLGYVNDDKLENILVENKVISEER